MVMLKPKAIVMILLALVVALTAWQFVKDPQKKDGERSSSEHQNKIESLNRDRSKIADRLTSIKPTVAPPPKWTLETVRRNVRRVDGRDDPEYLKRQELIARLPARPVAKAESKTAQPGLPPIPVRINRPLIDTVGYIESEDRKIRLADIAVPKPDQKCGVEISPWPCGRVARTALRKFIRGRTVICILPRKAEKELVVARCSLAGKDISEWMVENGWATVSLSNELTPLMEQAKIAGRGVWRQKNVDQSDWDVVAPTRARSQPETTVDPSEPAAGDVSN